MTLGETIRSGESPSRRVWFIALVVLCAVYALGVSNQWAISLDAALYLTLGQSLAEGRGMEFNGGRWWSIPPALPMLIAACRYVAGDGYWLINLVLAACGVGTAIVAARTVKRLGAEDLAFPLLLATGLSAYLFITAMRIQTDVPFALLVALGLYGFVRGSTGSLWWVLFGGAAMVLATLTRLPGVLFLASGLAGLALSLRRPRLAWRIVAMAAVIAFSSVVLWYWMTRIRTQADVGSADYAAAVSEQARTFFSADRLDNLLRGLAALPTAVFSSIFAQHLNSWAMLLPLLVILAGLVTLARRGQWIVVLPVACNLGFLILWGWSAVARRYILPTMPLLVYALLVGARVAVKWAWRRRAGDSAAASRVAVIVVVAVCLAFSVPKIAREICWMRSSDFYRVYDHGRWQDVVQASRYLREHGRPGVDAVMGSQPSVVHYLSGLRIFTQVLDPDLGTWEPGKIPPERFVKAALAAPARFVVIPADATGWSDEAAVRFAASGAFEPPVLIGVTSAKPKGTLSIYARRTASASRPGGGQLP
ncbi:MAG: glycosyltransferase family 39 protein [Acidobacteria bacterium]|nr:glycosyltransferase family 39 protein [Planctomycetota bacterium]MBE3132338.1 glycosyltransferase family 39 protein [Acidobacteriota bacterium]